MKWLSCVLCCMTFHMVSAQRLNNPDIQSLVAAEKAFMQMAKDKNTRDAFLYFLEDDAVTAAPGQGPRKGKEHLESRTPDGSWLYWRPAFTDIASSGDFGYNTGPWEFRKTRTDSDALAFGQFVSLWKKNRQGEWKVALDIGISHQKPLQTYALTTSAIRPTPANAHTSADEEQSHPEERFISSLREQGNDAYLPLISEEVKFLRPGNEPYTGIAAVTDLLNSSKEKVAYTFIGEEISSSQDLACVYGKASLQSIRDGVPVASHQSYVRFWKKENGNWKIVLDLLSD